MTEMTKLDMKTRITKITIISFLLLGSFTLSNTKFAILPSGIIFENFNDFSEGTNDNLTINPNRYISLNDNSWSNITSPGPLARYMHSMAIDNHNQTIVLFGGSIVYDPFSDTWVYNLTDNTWTQMSPTTSPPGRSRYSMVYDSTSDKFIVFGGLISGSRDFFGDTWVYDLAADTWTQMSPSTSPSARNGHSMVYDSNSDRVILFGGNNYSMVFDDTWTYSYTADTWTQMSPENAPSKRWYTSMVYDSTSKMTILFGGYDGTSEFNDTWVYNLTTDTWTQMNPVNAPTERQLAPMVYDSNYHKVILFGGTSYPISLNDTWVYDPSTNVWFPMTPSPSPSARQGHTMVYDNTSDQVILFGGANGTLTTAFYFDDTWAYSYEIPLYLLSPEDKTYTSPMSGYYPATYGFENEAVGTSGLDIAFVDMYDTSDITEVLILEELDGHKNILKAKEATGWEFVYNNVTDQMSGTVEFWAQVDDATQDQAFVLRDEGNPCIELWVEFDQFHWRDKNDIIYDVKSCLDDTWYHWRIDFRADNTFDWYIDGVKELDNQDMRRNLIDGIDQVFFKEYDPDAGWYLDAVGYSWDPGYTVGDNLNEGLLLSYFFPTPLNWTGYSLDGGVNVTILGNTTIPMPVLGTHTIQVFGNDSAGIYYQSKLRSFHVSPIELLSPEDKTYNAPMSGYYAGPYGFEDCPLGEIPLSWEYTYPDGNGFIRVEAELDGHKNVAQMRKTGGGTRAALFKYFTSNVSKGIIEFWFYKDTAAALDATKFAITGEGGFIEFGVENMDLYANRWVDRVIVGDNVVTANTWHHVQIDFDISQGGYQVVFDGVLYGSGYAYTFQNTPTHFYHFSTGTHWSGAHPNYGTWFDAFGFSFESGYEVGDNLKEGLLLSYNNQISLDWTGYSLDGGVNVTILGNTTIPMPVLGTHTIQVFGNVSTGDYYRSELRSFQIEPPIPPSVPLNLAATAGENFVTLSWSIPSSDGGSEITHYNIYRGTTTGSYSLLGNTPSTGYKDTTAVGGTTYYYVVTAVNSVGESMFSNEESATPDTPVTAPDPPQNLEATAGENSVTLSWSPPSTDGGSVITHYNIYRGTSSGSYSLLGNTPSTGYKDTNAIGGTTYYYVVTAVNSVGESTFSNEAKATPSKPQDTTATTATTTTTEASGPGISPSPGVLTILLFLGILVVFARKRKKS